MNTIESMTMTVSFQLDDEPIYPVVLYGARQPFRPTHAEVTVSGDTVTVAVTGFKQRESGGDYGKKTTAFYHLSSARPSEAPQFALALVDPVVRAFRFARAALGEEPLLEVPGV